MSVPAPPFAAFLAETVGHPPDARTQSRARISAARTRDERGLVAELLAEVPPPSDAATELASWLIGRLRARRPGVIEALTQAFALSSPAGRALMSLAEALPRIPDAGTRAAMVEEALAGVDWRAAAAAAPRGGLAQRLAQAIAAARATTENVPGGTAALRTALHAAVGRIGGRFIAGTDIGTALRRARAREALGYRHSYDMLGEAAVSEADAARYLDLYQRAIHAVGEAAARGPTAWLADRPVHGPGVSVKLSALHPRFTRGQRDTVMGVLAQRIGGLARLAARYDIGLTIDAEEADRLELTLDLFERLCADPVTARWQGLGIVVQAYQRAAPAVVDHLLALARQHGRRLMVRLVKGAYWDTEIKRAQLAGLAEFPVFTRKDHTDLAYLACAGRLLAAGEAVYPQFATHNAQSVAAIWRMAGGADAPRDAYEFQALYGMGEALYDEVVPPDRLYRPCRIYAPVGGHDALLAYLVRRLLENGANSAFVNRLADPALDAGELAVPPQLRIARAADPGAPAAAIAAPADLFGPRRNAAGLDLSDEPTLARLAVALSETDLSGVAPVGDEAAAPQVVEDATRPGLVLARIAETGAEAVSAAFAAAPEAGWAEPAERRAAVLRRAAGLIEAQLTGQAPAVLLALIVREAGRTIADGVGELREAIDMLRFYADAAEREAGADSRPPNRPLGRPLGRVVCISPWNFPVAIFVGQIAACLAAGNAVLAKPAVQTPLAGLATAALLHAAGVPGPVLQVLPGAAATGAALVGDARCAGVMFTGSTAVARGIARTLAGRRGVDGAPVPLVAETGGQNAIILDSTALAEQAVPDIVASAFNSAGQRCSAARILCVQQEVAEPVLAMLRGAMSVLRAGPPDRLSTDIGPLVSAEAAARVRAHVARLRDWGRPVFSAPPVPADPRYVAPTLIEVAGVEEIGAEVFGPVLHVVRFRAGEAPAMARRIAALGYGLTFGVQSRLLGRAEALIVAAGAGNAYVNRTTIGAVVGAQPFGGHGLSGTGPKAGGPLLLSRLLSRRAGPASGLPGARAGSRVELPGALVIWRSWLHGTKRVALAQGLEATRLGAEMTLPSPVGERNVYRLVPRGPVLCLAGDHDGLLRQIGAALATGNRALVIDTEAARIGGLDGLPVYLAGEIRRLPRARAFAEAAAALVDAATPAATLVALAEASPGVVPLFGAEADGTYPLDLLLGERAESINTAAIGGDVAVLGIA